MNVVQTSSQFSITLHVIPGLSIKSVEAIGEQPVPCYRLVYKQFDSVELNTVTHCQSKQQFGISSICEGVNIDSVRFVEKKKKERKKERKKEGEKAQKNKTIKNKQQTNKMN